MNRKVWAAAFPVTVPVLMGYLAIGMAFGLMLQAEGYGAPWALLMSLTIYAGSGQYLGVSLLAAGAPLAQVAFLTLMINFRHLVYGLSMIGLYTASTLYHCVNTTVRGRLALRKYDHCSIYLLIAGSYTPICMTVLWGGVGGPLLLAIWLCAAAGIILTITKLDIPRWLTSVIYLAMGWMALFAIAPLSRVLPAAGMFWLIAGGVLYTVGGVLYAVKWPGRNNPRFGCHEIFHVFIVLGSVSHFILMYSVVAPL
mgnify:CR=1 FL=1